METVRGRRREREEVARIRKRKEEDSPPLLELAMAAAANSLRDRDARAAATARGSGRSSRELQVPSAQSPFNRQGAASKKQAALPFSASRERRKLVTGAFLDTFPGLRNHRVSAKRYQDEQVDEDNEVVDDDEVIRGFGSIGADMDTNQKMVMALQAYNTWQVRAARRMNQPQPKLMTVKDVLRGHASKAPMKAVLHSPNNYIIMGSFEVVGKKIVVVRGNIARVDTDVIVNAANTQLQLGSGVAGAIKAEDRSGDIQRHCNVLAPIRVGETALTTGGTLPCKFVLHAVAPDTRTADWQSGLIRTYENVFHALYYARCTSIAVPVLDTGVFSLPYEASARALCHHAIDSPDYLSTIVLVGFKTPGEDRPKILLRVAQEIFGEA